MEYLKRSRVMLAVVVLGVCSVWLFEMKKNDERVAALEKQMEQMKDPLRSN